MTGNVETEIKQDDPGLSVPLDEVQVELEGGDQQPPEGEQQPEAQKADTGDGPTRRKKPRVDAAKRIGQLTAVNAQTAAEKAELERELAALRGDADERGNMALYYARKGLESDLKLAERELADVKRDGTDATAEAALTSRIAGIQAQLQTLPAVERPAARQAPQPEPERRPQPRRAEGPPPLPPPQLGTARADWESVNPWFSSNSPDFDAELHQEARIYAANLERRLQREGRAHEIDTPAYYQAISRYMDTEFFEQEPEPAPQTRTPTRLPQMTNTRSPVNAPSRGTPPSNNGNAVAKLDADQQDMALRFFGNKKHKDGTPYSREDAFKHYAWHQKNPNASMIPITMKTSRG